MIAADRLMREAVDKEVFPGGVLLVSKEDKIVFFEAYGYADIFSGKKMRGDTIFDLASLTKILATTVSLMKLVADEKLTIETKLKNILPDFGDDDKGDITICQLLTHTSGLRDWRPYYLPMSLHPIEKRKCLLREFLVRESQTYIPETKMIYSDLGFMILQWVIEQVSSIKLDTFVSDEIYNPLGLEHLFFTDTSAKSGNFAATERCSLRECVLRGVVHDENAYMLGGVSGHAGLFGNAEDIYRLMSEMLNAYYGHSSHGIFCRDTLFLFFQRRKASGRASGFDCPSGKDASCGTLFSAHSIGHTGFTGTSIWSDIDRFVTVILLTNRVHPSRKNMKIKSFRAVLHDAVIRGLNVG